MSVQAQAQVKTDLMTTTAKAPFIPSKMQAAFFQEMHRGSGSIILEAVAGSGKSTTIRRCLPVLPQRAHVLILAFSNLIAADMRAGIEELANELGTAFPNVSARTFHSLGLSAVAKQLGKPARDVESDPKKLRKLFKEMILAWFRDDADEQERLLTLYGSFVPKLVSLGKGIGIIPLEPDTFDSWAAIVAHHDLTLDAEDASEDEAIDLAHRLLRASNEAAKKGWIDFDDHLYLPLLWKLRLWQHDYVFVDECQPSGTLVTIPTGDRQNPGGILTKQVKIEDLKKGDRVVSFSRKYGIHRTAGQTLTEVKKRKFNGELIMVKTDRHTTRYTPNHWCWAKFLPSKYTGDHYVYLMRRGNQYRIGQCMPRWGDQSRLSSFQWRLKEEKADALWVLVCYPSKAEALANETLLSLKFNIPMTRFVDSRGKLSYASTLWSMVGDNSKFGEACLNAHGRKVEYPLFVKDDLYRPLSRPFLIRACNLMDGAMMLPFEGQQRHSPNDMLSIKISRQKYSGYVYSLHVEEDEMYVADSLTTHNCQDTNPVRRALAKKALKWGGRLIAVGDSHQSIFGFTGASTDALDLIQKEFSAKRMPLTVSYRCPKAAEPLVKNMVPYFSVADTAAEGAILHLGPNDGVARLSDRDAVLCRNTAPLVELAFSLIAQGRGCTVLGREIGQGLIDMIEKQRTTGIDRLIAKLDAYQASEVQKFMAKGEEEKADSLSDRIACIRTIAGKLAGSDRTVPGLIAKITAMFSEGKNGLLTLCTAHKAKGKEWKRVAILNPELMPSKFARQEWQQQQEQNLMYVAFTRFMEELIFLDGIDEDKGTDK